MQAQAALVGADGGVELHAEAAVDLDLALVVHPGHAEHHHALRLDEALEQAVLLVSGVGVHRKAQGVQHLAHRLMEYGLARVAGDDGFENGIYVIHVTFPFLCERMATPALDRTVLL